MPIFFQPPPPPPPSHLRPRPRRSPRRLRLSPFPPRKRIISSVYDEPLNERNRLWDYLYRDQDPRRGISIKSICEAELVRQREEGRIKIVETREGGGQQGGTCISAYNWNQSALTMACSLNVYYLKMGWDGKWGSLGSPLRRQIHHFQGILAITGGSSGRSRCRANRRTRRN